MKVYAAPLEGMTGYLWRDIHHRLFGGADRYFTPFLSPNGTYTFQRKELDELYHNGSLPVVPQLLTNSADHFLWAAREMAQLGYREINFNLGCPSGTVVAKRKGSGLLSDAAALDQLLAEIFAGLPAGMGLSLKTRVGRYDDAEWPAILGVYKKYPLTELIVHPRVQKDFYRGQARRELIVPALGAPFPVCYNGDIASPEDASAVAAAYPQLHSLMVGRGLMADPALLRRIRGGPAATREELRQYHDALYDAYCRRLGSELNAIYRMRELWNYLSLRFTDTDRFLKTVRKAKRGTEYCCAVERLFSESEMQ